MPPRGQKLRLLDYLSKKTESKKALPSLVGYIWKWKKTHHHIRASSQIWFTVDCLMAHLLGKEGDYHCRVSRTQIKQGLWAKPTRPTRQLGTRDILFLQMLSPPWHEHSTAHSKVNSNTPWKFIHILFNLFLLLGGWAKDVLTLCKHFWQRLIYPSLVCTFLVFENNYMGFF